MGCERPMVGATGFCSEEHNLAYCNRALDQKFKTHSGVGSVLQAVMESKDIVVAQRKQWKRDNPGKQLRYK